MFLRIDQHDAILVEQMLVAFDCDDEIAFVLECQPGSTITQNVGIVGRRDVEGRPHPLTYLFVPGASAHGDVDARQLPKIEFGDICTRSIATRYERGGSALDCRKRRENIP